jgi:type III secretion protein L
VQRLRADEFAALCDARELLARAHEQAQAMIAGAEAVREQARQEGLVQGREQGRDEALAAVAAMRAQLRAWVLETEPRLVELVSRCVSEVVRGVDVDALVRGSVERALVEVATANDIRIKVHEQQVPMMRDAVADLSRRHDLRGVIRVEPLASLKPGDCVVETPLGLLDLRLAAQLGFIQQALAPSASA